jgi:hypothetical protein
MLDLTVYLVGPTVQELEFLVDLYERNCPRERLIKYKIAELEYWSSVSNPDLTASARAAASAGVARPYLQPVRRRIQAGRAFELRYWDGYGIDSPEGSWSLTCRQIHLRRTGLYAFARIMLPVRATPETLRTMALEIAEHVEFHSCHGGMTFAYDPWLKEGAFDCIYAWAKRFWGVDVEDLNGTLPLMRDAIKGVNWITALGSRFASREEIRSAVGGLSSLPDVTAEYRRRGVVLVSGPRPVVGDRHRPGRDLDPYRAVAWALRPLFVRGHPDFPGERFISNGNTMGWIDRLVEPGGWN